MSEDTWSSLLRSFRRLEGLKFDGALSDAELLNRFLAQGDQAAFEVLVWRHGPMVLRACHRILGSMHDAEDAFQATFLVLFRKANSIGKRQSLAAWLHRVAYRVALRLQRKKFRLVLASEPLHDVAAVEERSASRHELDIAGLLDKAIDRLPRHNREAFVLCCLQGRSYVQAAAEIGCPQGTVQSRLARARERLQQWLKHQGVGVGSLGVVTGVTADLHGMEVPPTLIYSTLDSSAGSAGGAVSPALALANEFLSRGILVRACAAIALVLCGSSLLLGSWAWQVQQPHSGDLKVPSAHSANVSRGQGRAPNKKADPVSLPGVELPELKGEWSLIHTRCEGKLSPVAKESRIVLKLIGKNYSLKFHSVLELQGRLAGDTRANPKRLTLVVDKIEKNGKAGPNDALAREFANFKIGDRFAGIYARHGLYCWIAIPDKPGNKSPIDFTAKAGSNELSLRWHKIHRVLVKPIR